MHFFYESLGPCHVFNWFYLCIYRQGGATGCCSAWTWRWLHFQTPYRWIPAVSWPVCAAFDLFLFYFIFIFQTQLSNGSCWVLAGVCFICFFLFFFCFCFSDALSNGSCCALAGMWVAVMWVAGMWVIVTESLNSGGWGSKKKNIHRNVPGSLPHNSGVCDWCRRAGAREARSFKSILYIDFL